MQRAKTQYSKLVFQVPITQQIAVGSEYGIILNHK